MHSTATALIGVTDSLLEAADRGDISILTLIDLSGAFDVINHQTLLDQLQLLQISPEWFRNYLDGHQQCVQVSGKGKSALLPINSGIFQGSCLGPMLYNIASISAACYVPSEVNGHTVRMARYADDTQLVISGPKERLPEIRAALETALDTLATYFLQNGMKINAAKTEMLVVGGRSALQAAERDPVRVQFLGETLKPVSTAKNLGVIFDSRLSFEPHIDHVITKCFGILVRLAHAKHVLPSHVLPAILDALVLSHIRYCCNGAVSAGSAAASAGQPILGPFPLTQIILRRQVSPRRSHRSLTAQVWEEYGVDTGLEIKSDLDTIL